MNSKMVSIVICNYNQEMFLEDAILSALDQDYENIEVIVIDDGSTDNSISVMNRFSDHVKLIVNENNGQCFSYNTGFEMASGDIVLFLDADDALKPDAVSSIVPLFGSGVAKVHFFMDVIDEKGELVGRETPSILSVGDFYKYTLDGFLYYSAPASGNAYRKDLVKKIFPLPISQVDKHGADFFAIYGSAFCGSVTVADRVLGCYRIISYKENKAGIFFGNASQHNKEPMRQMAREERFTYWINSRLGINFNRSSFVSLSTVKIKIAGALLNKSSAFQVFSNYGADIAKVVFQESERRLFDRVLFFIWVLAILVFPESLKKKVIRYACNSISR